MDAAGFVGRVRAQVEARLREGLAARVESARRLGAAPTAVAETVADLALRGGKRLRASFVAAGAFAAGRRDLSLEVIGAAAAIEIFHTYLLIHDDWMDQDVVRRGGPTAHVVLAGRLGVEHGASGAILAGDLASAWSRTFLAEAGAPAQAHAEWAVMEETVVLGQSLDVAGGEGDPAAVILYKTTSYSVTFPLVIGASVVGGRHGADVFAPYSRAVGEAFQLRDDLLGLVGDPAQTGKAIGADLRNGKRTPPLLDALERGGEAVRRVHGRRDASDSEIRSAIDAAVACGAIERSEGRIRDLVASAATALEVSTFDDDAKALLSGLARLAAERKG